MAEEAVTDEDSDVIVILGRILGQEYSVTLGI